MARLLWSALDLQTSICKILLYFQVFGVLRLTISVIDFWVENTEIGGILFQCQQDHSDGLGVVNTYWFYWAHQECIIKGGALCSHVGKTTFWPITLRLALQMLMLTRLKGCSPFIKPVLTARLTLTSKNHQIICTLQHFLFEVGNEHPHSKLTCGKMHTYEYFCGSIWKAHKHQLFRESWGLKNLVSKLKMYIRQISSCDQIEK